MMGTDERTKTNETAASEEEEEEELILCLPVQRADAMRRTYFAPEYECGRSFVQLRFAAKINSALCRFWANCHRKKFVVVL